jgi:hypothetical protein
MRTTLDVDEDVLLAAKDIARREKRTAGEVISELARRGLRSANRTGPDQAPATASFLGFQPLEGGVPVTNELVNRLREELGE